MTAGSLTAAASEGTRKRPFWTIERRETATGLAFIAPQFAGIIVFVFVPLVLVFWYSLQEWNVLAGTFTFVGPRNYEQLLSDPSLPTVLWATLAFCGGLVVLNMVLALLLAVMLNQKLKGITTFRALFFSPVVVSTVAWTIVWGFLLQANGGINSALATLGIEGPNWLREPGPAMISLILAQLFKNVGLNMVLFLAALQGVPNELYEAARIDGVPRAKQFWRITLPLISPTVLLASIITIVGSLQAFANIAILTQGGPGISTTVLVYYFYQQAFKFLSFGYGSTISILLLAIVAVLTYAQWQMRKWLVFYEK